MADIIYVNSDDSWELKDTSDKIVYVKTLKTAGTFVDRDIKINVTAKEGEVTLPETDLTITPIIKYVNSSDSYQVAVSGNTTVVPQVTEGWVDNVSNGIIYVNGTLNLDATKLNGALVVDTSQDSGYSVYRTTATKGYNENNLTFDIDVYQGNLI